MMPTEMHIDALMEKIAKLESENARYREALERVPCAAEDHSVALSIAEEALKEIE